MNRPRREGTAAETPRSSPPACHRRPGLQGTAAPWHCLPPACSPVSPCPPGRQAPAPSHHGTRLLDLELSGRHQQEPPYRISFGFHRAAISSLLSCGQKRGHESASSTANQAGGAAAPALSSPLGFSGAPPGPSRGPAHGAHRHTKHSTGCSSMASPLLLAHPSPLPLPGCSLVLLVRPGRQTARQQQPMAAPELPFRKTGSSPLLPPPILAFCSFSCNSSSSRHPA